ncbi:uncharacterized protein [Vicugna pacos]|uniref:Uncharacterized protein isoform X2 n=1 Tax=Vicugna pacos TaxID=30538 RepID=A0ABM5C7E9_VICPA
MTRKFLEHSGLRHLTADRDLGLRRRRWVVRWASGLDGVTPFFPHVSHQARSRQEFRLFFTAALRGTSHGRELREVQLHESVTAFWRLGLS